MKKVYLLLCLLAFSPALFAQISGPWHSSCYDDYTNPDLAIKLKGKVKTWSMTRFDGETRTLAFDKKGKLTADSFKGTIQTYIPNDFLPPKLRADYEKKHPGAIADSTIAYNKAMQVVRRTSPGFVEENMFDEKGRVLMHKETHTFEETRAWNSTHHPEPTYTYTVDEGLLVLFRYDDKGNIAEAEYLSNDPFQNFKMVYTYDANSNLIKATSYDHYNISTANMHDDYLLDIFKSPVNADFDINRLYPYYWGQGEPNVVEWKYNAKNQKVEYLVYGYRKGLSFRAVWEYDATGRLLRETHYDVYHDRVRRVLDFDKKGNVIKETDPGYDGKADLVTQMNITYY